MAFIDTRKEFILYVAFLALLAMNALTLYFMMPYYNNSGIVDPAIAAQIAKCVGEPMIICP